MTIFLLAASAAFGWCGTKWPGWWKGPRPPSPDPEPWWLAAIGVVVGLAVGFAATRVGLTDRGFTLTDVAATGLIAFAGAAVVADLAGNLGGRTQARAGL